jgi:uncharacterized protein (TIGR03089 family)
VSLSALYPTLLHEKNGARPFVTYYDNNGRIELSYTSTRNWVSKSANFLIDVIGVIDVIDESRTISFDLSNHWLSVIWLLTTSALDLEIVESGGDIHVTDAITSHPSTTGAISIRSPRDLWGRTSPELLPKEINFATDVLTFPDYFQSENRTKALSGGKQKRKLFNASRADFDFYSDVILDSGSLVLVNGPTEIESIALAERID